jgi:hypothetical protein
MLLLILNSNMFNLYNVCIRWLVPCSSLATNRFTDLDTCLIFHYKKTNFPEENCSEFKGNSSDTGYERTKAYFRSITTSSSKGI